MRIWIPISTPPAETGQYRCRNSQKEFPAFLTTNLKGEKVWLKPVDYWEIDEYMPIRTNKIKKRQ